MEYSSVKCSYYPLRFFSKNYGRTLGGHGQIGLPLVRQWFWSQRLQRFALDVSRNECKSCRRRVSSISPLTFLVVSSDVLGELDCTELIDHSRRRAVRCFSFARRPSTVITIHYSVRLVLIT